MRSRQFRALVVSFLLAVVLSSVPITAAPRTRDGWMDREFSFISKVIAKIQKAFGVAADADTLTLPKP